MTGTILALLGGIGLFLFAMQTMTEALRTLAGPRVRAALARFTGTPLTGALTGTLATAAVQSSSGTTVAVVGFVGAGLIGFPQAVGVIFGANIGTTVTGWIVLLVGFKLKIGLAALPLVFAGSLARILGRGTLATAGAALAGFGLLFVGLDMMQAAMAGFEGILTPASFPPDTLPGRFRLLLLGAAVTAVTQSSSAGVASALVLLGTGAISFVQAAALVIGMDIGTTVTALLASVGGSRAMRQTGLAHVAYNVVTGLLGFALLPLVAAPIHDRLMGGDAQAGLIAFHTLFNLAGVVLMLPFATPFARAIERLVPDRPAPLAAPLDRRLLADPSAAIDAALASSRAISRRLLAGLGAALAPAGSPAALTAATAEAGPAIDALRDYIGSIAPPPGQAATLRRLSELLHLWDHLHRLRHRCGQHERLAPLLEDPPLRRPALLFGAVLRRLAEGAPEGPRLARLRLRLAARMARLRRRTLSGATGPEGAAAVFAATDAMRWLDRTAAHVQTLLAHEARAAEENPAPVPQA